MESKTPGQLLAVARDPRTTHESGPPGTLGHFLSDEATRYGANPALAIKLGFRTQTISYAELDRLALRVGRMLQERGVREGDRVVLWGPNMPAWVAAFFGCHKTGAVAVPLDVRSSPDFVASVVRQTDARFAFLSRATKRIGGDQLPLHVELEELDSALTEDDRLLDPVEPSPDDLAEVMFTSGTTGDPKGVMLTHRNVLANVEGVGQVIDIRPDFRLLSLLPLSHMLEQTVGLLAPLSGGCRITYPVSRQPAMLFRAIAENQVTMLVLVPQALQLFLNAIEREVKRQGREAAFERLFVRARHLPMHLRRKLFRRVHRRFGGNLEIVISGGAHLDPDLARRWELMGVTVLQGYGATEASPIISCDRPAERRAGAVGRPFPAVDLRINDDGEILAKGPNIFRGYWNNPAATQAVLRDGWYFTGDLGRIDADGFLYLSGRKKDLIVLANGQNVYPEDIEQCLIREPAVTDAVVIGLEGPGGGVQVHAALLLTDPSLAAAAVRAANAQLAAHQQIQGFTVWPDVDFPRTHTLKVKKTEVATRLRELQSAHEGSPASALLTHGSQDPMSTDPLRRLIGEVSGVATSRIQPGNVLGADLGLDSLMRVELLSAIEEELGVFVDEAVVTPETSVADLARYVAEAEPRAEAQGIVTWPLTPAAGIARELFLQGLVFPLYHVFWRVRVEGRERIQHLPGPVMVAANHHFAAGTFGMDPAAAWMALPRHLRRRTCTAGEEHAVFDPKIGGAIARLCNAFPLSKQGNVRGSLEYIGRLLDLGWSVLIFPEGNLFDGGPMRPFMGGTGLMAVECRVPVVPMWIEVKRRSVLQTGHDAWRGAFTVRIGEPLMFAPGTPYGEATAEIEAAVRALSMDGY